MIITQPRNVGSERWLEYRKRDQASVAAPTIARTGLKRS